MDCRRSAMIDLANAARQVLDLVHQGIVAQVDGASAEQTAQAVAAFNRLEADTLRTLRIAVNWNAHEAMQ